jgi:hypothetical protein
VRSTACRPTLEKNASAHHSMTLSHTFKEVSAGVSTSAQHPAQLRLEVGAGSRVTRKSRQQHCSIPLADQPQDRSAMTCLPRSGPLHCAAACPAVACRILCCSGACTWAALHEVASKKDELRLIQHSACPKHVHGFLCVHQMVRVWWVLPEQCCYKCR